MKTLIAIIISFAFLEFSSSQSKTELKFSSLVSQEILQQTVRDLVACGNRQGGTRSGDEAVSFLLKQFKSMGLQTEVLEDPERLTYTNLHWKLDVVEPASLRGVFKNAWLAGYSPSVKLNRARLVRVPKDGNLDRIDFDSAAVLVDAERVDQVYDDIAAKGATCMLTWVEPRSKAYNDCAMITSLPGSEKNPIPLFDISRRSALSLLKKLESKHEVIIEFSAKTRVANGKSKTVVATMPGKSKRYFIICAHGDSDSGGPGADDNASGDAGVLEVARVLATMRHDKSLRIPDSTIKFIIWGSEYASTGNYVKTHSSELNQIAAVLNYDEIGTGATRDCIYFEGNDQRINDPLLHVMQKVGEDYVGRKGFWKEATTNSSQGGTDSYVFLPNYLSRLGMTVVEIPSVTIYTAAWEEPKSLFQSKEWRTKAWKGPRDSVLIDYSLYYHSSLDIPSKTTDREPYDMVWGVKATGLTLLRLLWR